MRPSLAKASCEAPISGHSLSHATCAGPSQHLPLKSGRSIGSNAGSRTEPRTDNRSAHAALDLLECRSLLSTALRHVDVWSQTSHDVGLLADFASEKVCGQLLKRMLDLT